MKKEEVFEKLAEKGLSYLENFEQFAKTEIPDYLQQIVKYYFTVNLAYTVLGLLVAIACIYGILKAIAEVRKEDGNENIYIPLFIVCGTIFVFTIALASPSFETMLKAGLAPKVFLVDYFRGKE